MDERRYDRDMYNKMYDMVELIYILNRLSKNSYIDERSKKYLIGMLNDVEYIKSNFDKYRVKEPYVGKGSIGRDKYEDYDYSGKSTFIDKIIFFLKSLNDEE